MFFKQALVVIVLSTIALAGCATQQSPVQENYSQRGYCAKRANTAYRIRLDIQNGVSRDVLAQQIESSNESATSKMLDLTALDYARADYDPSGLAHKVFVNCMHMDIPKSALAPQPPIATPACPSGYTCTPNKP